MYLVDTNVVSDAQRRRPRVVKWLRSVDSATIYLSVITLGEIHRGVVFQRTRDPAAATALSVWLQTLRDNYRGRTLLVTEAVAIEWGRISAGRSRGIGDSLIAVTAIVHQLVVVTRNVKDFADIGVAVIDPWTV